MPRNDWNQYKQLFLRKIQEDDKKWEMNSERWEKAFEMLDSLKADVGGLKMKAALAGGTAGVIGTALVTFAFGLLK